MHRDWTTWRQTHPVSRLPAMSGHIFGGSYIGVILGVRARATAVRCLCHHPRRNLWGVANAGIPLHTRKRRTIVEPRTSDTCVSFARTSELLVVIFGVGAFMAHRTFSARQVSLEMKQNRVIKFVRQASSGLLSCSRGFVGGVYTLLSKSLAAPGARTSKYSWIVAHAACCSSDFTLILRR